MQEDFSLPAFFIIIKVGSQIHNYKGVIGRELSERVLDPAQKPVLKKP